MEAFASSKQYLVSKLVPCFILEAEAAILKLIEETFFADSVLTMHFLLASILVIYIRNEISSHVLLCLSLLPSSPFLAIMATVLKLSGRGYVETANDLVDVFQNEYESQCTIPPSDDLRLLLTLIDIEKNEIQEGVCNGPKSGNVSTITKLGDDLLLRVSEACLHLLLHRNFEGQSKSERTQYDLIQKIIISCSSKSIYCQTFILEYCTFNLVNFSNFTSKGHGTNEESLNYRKFDKVFKCSKVPAELCTSVHLPLLLSLTEARSQQKQITEGMPMDNAIFDSLLAVLTCGAENAVMAVASQIVSFYLETDANKMVCVGNEIFQRSVMLSIQLFAVECKI